MGLLHGSALEIARRLHGPASVILLVLLGVHVLAYFARAARSTAGEILPAHRVRVLVPAQHRWIDPRPPRPPLAPTPSSA